MPARSSPESDAQGSRTAWLGFKHHQNEGRTSRRNRDETEHGLCRKQCAVKPGWVGGAGGNADAKVMKDLGL